MVRQVASEEILSDSSDSADKLSAHPQTWQACVLFMREVAMHFHFPCLSTWGYLWSTDVWNGLWDQEV
jgi:hypothetical protein